MTLEDLVRLRQARDRGPRLREPLDVPALARTALMSRWSTPALRRAAGRRDKLIMTRRIERAKALLRRGDLTVTEVCFAGRLRVAGFVQSALHRAVGESPSAQPRAPPRRTRRPPCVAKIHTRPIRNGEARPAPGADIVSGMDIKLSTCFIAVDDHDKALAFLYVMFLV